MRIAINGFGRIGRNFLRALVKDPRACKKIECVAINIGPADIQSLVHMFKYDSLMGTYPGKVNLDNTKFTVDDHSFDVIAECSMDNLPWKQLGVDCVVECSGQATKREKAQKHIDSGARYVLISAPAKREDIACIPGVNHTLFDPQVHHIISLGSCTSNAFFPLLKILHDKYGIEQGFMSTVHAYTNSQVLLDRESGDLRRARAAGLNIIPTTTGATEMTAKIIPELSERINGMAIRVPVAKVSFIDLACTVKKIPLSIKDLNAYIETTAEKEPMQGIIGITHAPLVSIDFYGDDRSVIVDGQLTMIQGNLVKVCGWYDNEWAYSVRLKDFVYYMAC